MKEFIEYMPFIIPLMIVEFLLVITAVVHVIKHNHYRFGNRIMWIIIVLCIQIIGPVVYFTFGRGEE